MKPWITTAALLIASVVSTQVAAAQAPENPNYTSYPGPHLIQQDLSDLDRVYRRNYHKFIEYKTGADQSVLLVANNAVSDEQLLRAYNILDFYLTDVPGSAFGADKSAVAQHMGQRRAVLVLPDGADGQSRTRGRALAGQPLYELEFPVEGSPAYMNNDFDRRDAGFEEIFHLVHDMGIGTKFSDGVLRQSYQAEITKSMEFALANDLWARGDRDTKRWIRELRREGSLEQEYIASVIDSYYGYWGAYDEAEGGMWGIYVAKTRDDIARLDPAGLALIESFLPPMLTYMARVDPAFEGNFSLSFDPAQPYTHKSQYLLNARLVGSKNAGLVGNDEDNILMGNSGSNTIDGGAGWDVVQLEGPSEDYHWSSVETDIVVEGPEGRDTLRRIEVLRFTDRDVALN